MLEDVRKSYVKRADAVVPEWRKLDVNALCNLYVENEKDPIKQNGYFAAVLLKKWGYIGRHYLSSKASGFTIEDCYDMVLDATLYALNKRMWLNPKTAMYNDPAGPDKILNRVIYSRRQLWYYNANCGKRRANYGKSSLDQLQETVGDHCEILSEDYGESTSTDNLNVKMLIKSFFDDDRVLEGIILDNIISDDCFSARSYVTAYFDDVGEEEKVPHSEVFFKLGKLVNNLSEYNEETVDYLSKVYDVEKTKIEPALEIIHSSDKGKLGRIIKALLLKMGSDKGVKGTLCC